MENKENIIPESKKNANDKVSGNASTYHYPSAFDQLQIYTDGSLLKASRTDSKGMGGYGLIVYKTSDKTKIYEKSDSVNHTTNNRMELTAMLEAFKYLENNNFHSVVIYCDSEYCVNPLTKGWIHNWHKKDYKDKANSDLWKQIYPLFVKFRGLVTVQWVKGHSINEGNNAVDKIANGAAKELKNK